MQKLNRTMLNLVKNSGPRWYVKSVGETAIYVKGYAFCDGVLLEDEKLANLFIRPDAMMEDRGIADRLEVVFKTLNGCFAVVIAAHSVLIAAVDRIRSIPLFYGIGSDMVYVSDDANWVRKEIGDHEFDEVTSKEFLIAGYVTGPDTLFPHVKQLQPGEFLTAETATGRPEIRTRRYYYYVHREFFDASPEDLYPVLGNALANAFGRLLESTRGRTLAVPLSGGVDSRLVVAMLKHAGVERVICYSYGRPGNWESSISKEVAEKLGYQWEFIEYTNKTWRQWFQSKERLEHYAYNYPIVSMPPLQDWCAVWELKKAGKVPEEAVFVPGDTPALNLREPPEEGNMDAVVESVLASYYTLWHFPQGSKDFKTIFKDRIGLHLKDITVDTLEGAVDAFEAWQWQNFQPKLCMNRVRAFEFWGHEWRVPLWDNEVMDFFSHVPFALRLHKQLYRDYISRHLFSPLGIDIRTGPAPSPPTLPRLRGMFRGLPWAKGLVHALRRKLQRFTEYDSHFLAWYGIVPRRTFYTLYHPNIHFNSFRSLDILENMQQYVQRKN